MTLNNKTWPRVDRCIYCGNTAELTREHVLPYGLGGTIELLAASCKSCAKITGALEQKLLRGHWWPYRRKLGLKTRSKSYPAYQPVTLKTLYGESIPAKVSTDDLAVVLVLEFDPPSLLEKHERTDYPFAPRVFAKYITPMPSRALVDGSIRNLRPGEQIEVPINFDAGDFTRFLAKVAHGYAIYARGTFACSEYFLPKYILGSSEGLLTFVGGSSSAALGSRLPGTGVHALLDRLQGEYLSIYIQLFRDDGDPPPIYEVIVGKLNVAS